MESTIDQQFVEYVVKSLVGNPDDVVVERTVDEKGVLLLLTVNPEDLGRVIGKRGATAQSLRTLLRALGTKQEARFNLKIVDNGEPKPEREDRNGDAGSAWSSTPSTSNNDQSSSDDNDDDDSSSDDSSSKSSAGSSAAQDAANDSGEEESAVERTRRELMDLDDLDV